MCDWQETSSYAGLLWCSKLQQFAKNPKHNSAHIPKKLICCEEKRWNLYTLNMLTLLLHLLMHICVANTLLSAVSLTSWNIAWGLLQSKIWSLQHSHLCTKHQSRLENMKLWPQPPSALLAVSVPSLLLLLLLLRPCLKWERRTWQWENRTWKPTAEEAVKERDCTQMPVAKKERTNHKCWWQTKTDRPNKASQQLTPNEGNKTARTTSKPQTAAYLWACGE